MPESATKAELLGPCGFFGKRNLEVMHKEDMKYLFSYTRKKEDENLYSTMTNLFEERFVRSSHSSIGSEIRKVIIFEDKTSSLDSVHMIPGQVNSSSSSLDFSSME
jgi:hypothetical protein